MKSKKKIKRHKGTVEFNKLLTGFCKKARRSYEKRTGRMG